jgi:hypothetical protein
MLLRLSQTQSYKEYSSLNHRRIGKKQPLMLLKHIYHVGQDRCYTSYLLRVS